MEKLRLLVLSVFQRIQSSFSFRRGIVSMAILNVTETQAGEYLLHIQSEAANYTVLFTVNVRGKCGRLLGTSCVPRQCVLRDLVCFHSSLGSPKVATQDFLTQAWKNCKEYFDLGIIIIIF